MKDLRSKLTVFLISSGEPDYTAAKKALAGQDCQFSLEEIKNISPMNVAFQQMLDRCTTPYYIQVDGDMVLKPSAVRLMFEEFQKPSLPDANGTLVSTAKIAFVTFLLHDVHLRCNIYGVKIYRHEVMKRYPYTDSYSCEVDQAARLRKDKFLHVDVASDLALSPSGTAPTVMGKHSPTWTPSRIYNRYRRLAQKWRRFGYFWLGELPAKFFDRAEKSKDPLDWWAFLGFCVGAAEPLETEQEQDSKRTDEGFQRLENLLKILLR